MGMEKSGKRHSQQEHWPPVATMSGGSVELENTVGGIVN